MPGEILTATPTSEDVETRLLALLTQLMLAAPDVLASIDLDGSCAIDEDYLPSLIGLAARGVTNVQKRAVGITDETRDYEFRVLFMRVASSEAADQLAAVNEAKRRMNDIPGWLARYPLLQLNNVGMRGVRRAGRAQDANGVELATWRGEEWSAVTYRLPITTTS